MGDFLNSEVIHHSILLAKECFDEGNFPKILLREEFQKESMESLLELATLKPQPKEGGESADVEMKPAATGSPEEWT